MSFPNRIFLSPHPDDIAYSCYGSVVHRPQAPRSSGNSLIVTVFSTSQNATPPFKEDRTVEEISNIRRAEDEAFARSEGLPIITLGLPDTGIRGEPNSGPDYCMDDSTKHPIFQDVKAAISKVIGPAIGHTDIYVPLGILGHLDHRIVRDCARQIVAESGVPGALCSLRYYEDQPYANFTTETEIRKLAKRLISPNPRFREVSLRGLWDRKRRAAQMYASQLKPFTLKALADYSSSVSSGELPEVERVWVDDGYLAKTYRPRSMDLDKLGTKQHLVQPLLT